MLCRQGGGGSSRGGGLEWVIVDCCAEVGGGIGDEDEWGILGCRCMATLFFRYLGGS